MSRTLVIGDIHGALKALTQVWERAQITPNDTIIFLGDYVDGWSQSAELISYLIKVSKTHQCIFIRGNHDQACYESLTQKNADQWIIPGAKATKKSYDKLPKIELPEHISFFENLVNYYVDDSNRLFVHAGFTHPKGVKYENPKHSLYWDRTFWKQAISIHSDLKKTDVTYPKILQIYKETFVGHTPLTKINRTIPLKAASVWNIDTGATFKGPLTIMDVNSKEFWQSDPVYKLYPNEKGRNMDQYSKFDALKDKIKNLIFPKSNA